LFAFVIRAALEKKTPFYVEFKALVKDAHKYQISKFSAINDGGF
jgi:hypothetical protein